MKLNKHIKLVRFTNLDAVEMFSITFITGPESQDNYRGWEIRKAKKVAKMFRKLATKLEKL